MRHATYGLVKQQTGTRRTGQGLVVEGVVCITGGVRSDRTDEALFTQTRRWSLAWEPCHGGKET